MFPWPLAGRRPPVDHPPRLPVPLGAAPCDLPAVAARSANICRAIDRGRYPQRPKRFDLPMVALSNAGLKSLISRGGRPTSAGVALSLPCLAAAIASSRIACACGGESSKRMACPVSGSMDVIKPLSSFSHVLYCGCLSGNGLRSSAGDSRQRLLPLEKNPMCCR